MKKKQILGALLGLAIMGTTLPTHNVEAASKHKLTATEQKALFFSDLVYEVPKEKPLSLDEMGIKKSDKYADFRKEISDNLPKGVSFSSFYEKSGLKNYRMSELVRKTTKYPQMDKTIKLTGVVVRVFYDKTGRQPTYMAVKGTSNVFDYAEDMEIMYGSQIADFYSKRAFTQLHALAVLYALNEDSMKMKSGQPIILTGHSLGGRHANFLGTIGKLKAITFAAPPFTQAEKTEMKKYVDKRKSKYSFNKNITNFQYSKDEITTPLIKSYLPGTTYTYSSGAKFRNMKDHKLKNYYKHIAK